MSSEYDHQTPDVSLADVSSSSHGRFVSREHVTALASEVLNQVARRAIEIRKALDKQAILAAAVSLTSGSEEEAASALESLDDPLQGLDTFLSARLGPIAKEIGTLWNTDKISFLEATVGASRIYSYLRYRRRPTYRIDHGQRKSATFALVPGDMHTLGISAATDVFRARGWDITLLIGHSHEELCAQFEASKDLIFGFSAGSTHSLEPLGRLVVALTVARPAAVVLISGQLATDPAAVLALPGVDNCDPDLESAYRWFEAQTLTQPA